MDEAQYQKIVEDSRAYLNTRYELLRLSLLEKLSRVLGLLLLALTVVLLLFAVLAFGALALVYVLAQWIPVWSAFLIIGAVFLLLLVLAFVCRKQWFINPIVGALSTILFADDAQQENPQTEKGGEV
ncbi:MAG: phage holin family protein [Paludibacteraceae bacterium]